MADPDADQHDLLVRARSGLAVTYARYWLALRRASTDEGTGRAAARAEAGRQLARARALRAQALQAASNTDRPMEQSQRDVAGAA
jgi:hypothetical protein